MLGRAKGAKVWGDGGHRRGARDREGRIRGAQWASEVVKVKSEVTSKRGRGRRHTNKRGTGMSLSITTCFCGHPERGW